MIEAAHESVTSSPKASDDTSSHTIESERVVILLVGNYAPDAQRSMARYARLLGMAIEQSGGNVITWLPPVVFGRIWSPKATGFKWIAYLDKLLIAPICLLFRQIGASRVHICDHSNSFYAFAVWARRCTATCHDVIAIQAAQGLIPGWTVGASGRLLQRLIALGLGKAESVLCVSEHTRKQLLELGLTEEGKTVIAPNPLDPAFFSPVRLESPRMATLKHVLGKQYFIHVGSDLPRKNRQGLFEIFSSLVAHTPFADAKLLLVGPPPNAMQMDFLRNSGLTERVHQVSHLDDADLAAAYRDAVALIFPSLQEGFGWPIAEAQICGCPVFASRLPPMPEVGGSAARYFDPSRPGEAAELVLNSSLTTMQSDGRAHAIRYSLEHLAKVFGK